MGTREQAAEQKFFTRRSAQRLMSQQKERKSEGGVVLLQDFTKGIEGMKKKPKSRNSY